MRSAFGNSANIIKTPSLYPACLSVLTVSKETAAHWYSEGTLHKQLWEKEREGEQKRERKHKDRDGAESKYICVEEVERDKDSD